MNYEKLFDFEVPGASFDAWKKEGKKSIGTICCHVPEEIIHAAGMLPVRLRATGCKDSSEAETWMSSLSCSFARSCLQYLIDEKYDLDGVVTSEGCLMASRIFDNWEHIDPKKKDHYLKQIAAPRIYREDAVKYYAEELDSMRRDLEDFSGQAIPDEKIKASVELFNGTRGLIRELYELRKSETPVISGEDALKITLAATNMPKEEFNSLLRGFLDEADKREPITDYKARLMLIGSAMDDPEYIKVIEGKGGLVVTDSTCFGSRYLWEPVEVAGEDIIGSMADSYLKRPVCPRSIDLHDDLHDFIMEMAEEYRVDGIVYAKLQNCECWGGETVYLDKIMKDAGLPMLVVEREELMANVGQLEIRAEAFIEMIEREV